MEPGVAVLDIGKTHARLSVANPATGEVVFQQRRRCHAVEQHGIAALDVAGIEAWLLAGLASAAERCRIESIVPVAHGAAVVFLDAAGNALLAPDYEYPGFEGSAGSYRPLRDDFASTFSPFLPLGLNLGRQFHHVQRRLANVWARTSSALLYPQYWAERLSGIAASEITSLGCHTDLWRPAEGGFSTLALGEGWNALLPPLRNADEPLGRISPAVVRATRLPPDCRVVTGIHDSNASWLCHLDAAGNAPFAMVSSGTWTVVMARGTPLSALVEADDMLANVDARGHPTPTARFMGGREYAAIAGLAGSAATPGFEDLRRVIEHRAMALPAFATGGGPYRSRTGALVGTEGLAPEERAALATLYVALMTDMLLDRLAFGSGNVFVDGPLADNPLYCCLLATLRQDATVFSSVADPGHVGAGLLLAGRGIENRRSCQPHPPVAFDQVHAYRDEWRERLATAY